MSRPEGGRPIEILLVEDNPGDVRLVQEALKDGKVLNRMSVAWDGAEALAFLRREAEHAGAPRPDLILLDLNLPARSGHEVLAEIKRDPEFKRIPVVILTSSRAEADVVKAYDRHANCYVTKPVTLTEFLGVVRTIERFWLTIVELPPNGTRSRP